ncbi:hypothetical protein [Streptomyces microflavus]|uniref:hypothetical protein n=1 Tax=Streptomyces microflavus TaxID=1919 RepID=UPI002E37F9C3|nr:hypothetical protein [Streptomyces microflavus]
MALSDRHIELRRDPHSGEVLAHGGDPEAHSILQRTGFIHVLRQHEQYHRVPTNLDQAAEETLATAAVSALRSVGYWVACDAPFDTDRRTDHYLSLGAQVAALANNLRRSTTTQDAAAVLTELTAAHDGVLAALGQVLNAAEEFFETLDQGDSRHTAAVVRGLTGHHLAIVATQVHRMRNELADRHEEHPARRPCPSEVADHEREASVHCPCPITPPPPRPPAPPPARRL